MTATTGPAAAPPYILVVEDDKEQLDQLLQLMAGAGYRAMGACSAVEGLKRIADAPRVFVLVSDVHLPDGSAIEFLRRVNEVLPPPNNPKALLITGKPTLDTAMQAIGLQVVDYISKPVRPPSFLDSVARAWKMAEAREGEVPPASQQDSDFGALSRANDTQFVDEYRNLLARLKQTIAARKERKKHLPTVEFKDPAWNILLELMLAHMEQAPITVTSLCLSTGVPTTTALRRLEDIVKAGLAERHSDPLDKRRILVRLTVRGVSAMTQYLRRIAQ